MAVSVFKTFSSGEVLTASDLNSSFTQIVNNGEDLGWPATKAKDLNGQELILDADADTSITADTDDQIDFRIRGVDLFIMDGAEGGTTVNGLEFVASATLGPVVIRTQGSDTNIDLELEPKAAGAVRVDGSIQLVDSTDNNIEDSSGNELIDFTETASAVGQLTVTNAATGNNPILGATSSDTDVGIDFALQAAGAFQIISTDAGATVGPTLSLHRNSASPADNDVIGSLNFDGEDSGDTKTTYARIQGQILDVTDTEEDGELEIATNVAGTLANRVVVGNGMYMAGATGGDQGADSINASSLFLDGLVLPFTQGLVLSRDTDTAHDTNITAGIIRNADADGMLVLSSEITKKIDVTWAAGDDAGGLSSTLTAPANDTWYHVFLILVSGSVDVGYDTSVVAANLITDHSATEYALIGSVLTNGSANIIAYVSYEIAGGGLQFEWLVADNNLTSTNPGTSAITQAMTCPLGIKTRVNMSTIMRDANSAGSDVFGLITSLDITDTTPTSVLNNFVLPANASTVAAASSTPLTIRTDTSSQIRAHVAISDAGITMNLTTHGWIQDRV